MASVHAASQVGFAKGTNELYNKARPQYPTEVVSHLRQVVKSSDPLNVVEIGPGTGLFTRVLLAHPEWTAVRELKAVEPSEGMREALAKYTTDKRVVISDGTFDKTGVESGWADVIVIAQAFHWCLDYEAAAAEFARVLKPEGVLALIWNLDDRETTPWLKQVRERVERDAKGSPSWLSGNWRQIFSTPSYVKFFGQPKEQSFRYDTSGTMDGIVNRGLSSSRIATLPDTEKAAFVKDVEAIVQRGEGKVWIEQEKGIFLVAMYTNVVIAERVV
ncbi:S-adenosyl-L-methionine-dependent methyltransferase [Mycena epipterygia]|nr:S-adenosyl-L-methionine-dependent methyltransferase [Mycena epipterygia]